MPETVTLDTVLAEQRGVFLAHLTDDQLWDMCHDPKLIRNCDKNTWYHMALHLASRLKFPSCRVADRQAGDAAMAADFRLIDEEAT